jgi:antitoxin (DNA-binding transcriptional repressor) of toxin-antitoxin stability system
MRTVNIAELKNKLSMYITYAKAGETVIIRDRNKAVAQLTPLPVMEDGLDEEERELIALGKMRPAKLPWNPKAFLAMPLPKPTVPGNSLTQALLDERAEGR